MKLNELGDHDSQLKKINQYLLENFGYTINMESIDSVRVNSTLKKVLARQAQIANETNVKDYHKIPEYNKTVMVAEALKILLREIAPKRQAKEKNTNVQESKMTQQVKEDAWIKGREKSRQRASGSVRDLPGASPPAQSGPKKEKIPVKIEKLKDKSARVIKAEETRKIQEEEVRRINKKEKQRLKEAQERIKLQTKKSGLVKKKTTIKKKPLTIKKK